MACNRNQFPYHVIIVIMDKDSKIMGILKCIYTACSSHHHPYSISVFIKDFARQPTGHTNNTLAWITGQAIDTLRRHIYNIVAFFLLKYSVS